MAKKTAVPVQAKASPLKADTAAAGFESVTLNQQYVPARLPTGKVVGVWGDALMRTSSGEIRAVQVGDVVQKGDVILTTQKGIVQLEGPGTRLARLPGLLETDRALASSEEEFEAPAAGLAGGGDGGFQPGLRIDRIVEGVNPLEYSYDSAGARVAPLANDTGTESILPSLAVTDVTVPESSGFAVFAVQLSAAATSSATVNLALGNGTAAGATAAAAGDFGSTTAANLQVSLDNGVTWASTTSVTIPAGQTTVLVRTPLVNDSTNEAPETFTLTATPTAGTVSPASASGTATITDDDPQPSLAINDVVVNEGASTANFTVSLSAASGQTVTVTWTTVNGVAAGGADFTTSTGSLTFAPGETTKTIAIPVINDTMFEKSEAFTVDLSGPTNASIADGSGLGTITDDGSGAGGTDDDTPIAVLAGPAEVNEAAGTVTYTVTLSNLSTLPVSIPFSFASSGAKGATLGTDLTATAGTLVIPAGSSTGTITVLIREDTVFEGAEAYSVNLGTPTNARLGTSSVTTSIVDGGNGFTPDGSTPTDDRPVVSAITSPSVTEGGNLDFIVTLSGTSTIDTIVTLTPANGPLGTFGTDTQPALQVSFDGINWLPVTAGQVSVPAGSNAFTVRMATLNDGLGEPTETVTLGAATAQNNTAAPVIGVGTILDANTPVVSIGPATATYNEATGTATYTVTLSNASTIPATVNFTTVDGTARVIDNDYSATTGTLTFAPGETSKTITVAIKEDLPYEGAETFSVVLSQPTAAVLGAATSVSTIVDDGSGSVPPGTIATDDRLPTVAAASVHEGGALTFTVNLASATTQTTAYAFALAPQDPTTTTSADYNAAQLSFTNGVTLVNGQLIVPAGVTSFNVVLPTTEDRLVEGNEVLTLQVGTAQVIGTILNEDAAVAVDESALANGNLESAPSQSTTAAQDMAFGSPSGTSYSFGAIAELTALNLQSGTSAVTWAVNSSGTALVGTVPQTGSDSPTKDIVSITLNPATGATAVALLGPLNHPTGQAANLIELPVNLLATTGGVADARSLTITVTDDVPTTGVQNKTVAVQDTNLLIVLDTSGSMRETDGTPSSRLTLAIKAVKDLVNLYDDAGDVRVTLLTFNSTSGTDQVIATGATALEAITLLEAKGLTPNGFTNYDAAIASAQTQFESALATDGKHFVSGQNVSYFLSDGRPEGATDAETLSNKLDTAEQASWQGFLTDKNVQSYAIGFGSQLTNPATAADFRVGLDSVAYDGRNNTDPTSGVILVNAASNLAAALASTVPAPLTGTLLGDLVNTNADAGADGGYLSQIGVASLGKNYVFDGTTVTGTDPSVGEGYDPTTHELAISLAAAGALKVNLLTGVYTFDPLGAEPVTISYAIQDTDGDISNSILNIQAVETTSVTGASLGPDTLTGTGGANVIDGRSGNDAIDGGAGNDTIYGGAGNDTLTGGLGSDVFAWRLADVDPTTIATDRITDFNTAIAASGGDILDLRDLLQGETTTTLGQYLHFETNASGTTLHISSSGKFTADGSHAGEDQIVVLQSADLSGLGSTNAQIIQSLMDQGKLITDPSTGG